MSPSPTLEGVGHPRGGGLRIVGLCGLLLLAGALAPGCALGRLGPTPLEREIARAARPILAMDPDAVWTDCYNRLVELAPASIAYLAEHPSLTSPAAPDDLRVMMHMSLLRLLIYPPVRPKLSATCLETTRDVLHFDLKVAGQRLGTAVLPVGVRPASWLDMYPVDFDHARAGQIDIEADRRALRAWWRVRRGHPESVPMAGPLCPRPQHLWRLLARRCADQWSYQPRPHVVRCGPEPGGPALIELTTRDYNQVWATCVWLGSREQVAVRDRLIELVGSPVPVVAHNALFALRFAPDPRIRELLKRYIDTEEPLPGGNAPGTGCPPTVTHMPAGAERSDS